MFVHCELWKAYVLILLTDDIFLLMFSCDLTLISYVPFPVVLFLAELFACCMLFKRLYFRWGTEVRDWPLYLMLLMKCFCVRCWWHVLICRLFSSIFDHVWRLTTQSWKGYKLSLISYPVLLELKSSRLVDGWGVLIISEPTVYAVWDTLLTDFNRSSDTGVPALQFLGCV